MPREGLSSLGRLEGAAQWTYVPQRGNLNSVTIKKLHCSRTNTKI